MNDTDAADINEDSGNADYAAAMSQRICKKAGLKQLLLSFNVDKILVNKFMQTDPMIAPLIEKSAKEFIMKHNV